MMMMMMIHAKDVYRSASFKSIYLVRFMESVHARGSVSIEDIIKPVICHSLPNPTNKHLHTSVYRTF